MIKLLALDLDGTLLDPHGVITDRNRNAIRQAEDRGVLVTVATGRRFRDARPVAYEAELNAPLITHNGALLKYGDSLKTVAASLISPETAGEVLRAGRDFGGDALISADPAGKGTLYFDRVSDDNIPLQRYLAWSEKLHGDEAAQAVVHVGDLDEVARSTEIIHVSFSGKCGQMEDMLAALKSELGNSVNILATIYPLRDFTLLDVLPPDASKGHGVEKLAALNDIEADEVMVIGDNFNDLEMLEMAGTPVVMGNADPSLLERAEFYTTLSNDESGVAAAIERFILNEENI